MLRSLYSGISGLRAHQTMMDVTGNNISNVNTAGYKAAATLFQDTLSQTVATGGRPQTPDRGGVNAAQIGLGVKLADIATNFRQGTQQPTGVGTDLMIQGDGFFIVQESGQTLYTRSGGFHFDSDKNLVAPNGAYVMGYAPKAGGGVDTNTLVSMTLNADPADLEPTTVGAMPGTPAIAAVVDDPATPADETAAAVPAGPPTDAVMTSYAISSTGEIIGQFNDNKSRVLGQIVTATFVNPNGLEKAGNSTYRSNATITGTADVGAAGTGGRGPMTSGSLEMSNVDLAQEFTNLIVAQRGFQANSRVITTSDELLQELVNLKR